MESAIDRVVLERWVILELVIEAEPRKLADRTKIPEIERPDVQPRHGVAVELVIPRVNIVRARHPIAHEQFRSRSVFVVGEVRSPGKYPMTGQMSLIEALAAAGSTTPAASTEVLILRPPDAGSAQPVTPLTPDQADRTNVQRINLADLQLGRLSENVMLMEGDTIFVPKAEKFYMTGQIRNPGAYTYERGLTVLQAISLAGGLTDKGSNRRLKVIRTVNGKKTQQGIDLNDAIQPGDTLVIPQRLL